MPAGGGGGVGGGVVTVCLFQAPARRPDGSERRCHSQLFIRPHIHSLSITVRPPGPVTSLYVYYARSHLPVEDD